MVKRLMSTGPTDAIRQGIGMVHQHFMLIPVLTVTENVMLGEEEIHNGLFLNRKGCCQPDSRNFQEVWPSC